MIHETKKMNKKLKDSLAKSGEEKCGILYTYRDFKDVSGCLKNHAHNDAHICETDNGEYMEWEDDYECKCGCWVEYGEGCPDVCMIYSVVGKVKINKPKK